MKLQEIQATLVDSPVVRALSTVCLNADAFAQDILTELGRSYIWYVIMHAQPSPPSRNVNQPVKQFSIE